MPQNAKKFCKSYLCTCVLTVHGHETCRVNAVVCSAVLLGQNRCGVATNLHPSHLQRMFSRTYLYGKLPERCKNIHLSYCCSCTLRHWTNLSLAIAWRKKKSSHQILLGPTSAKFNWFTEKLALYGIDFWKLLVCIKTFIINTTSTLMPISVP